MAERFSDRIGVTTPRKALMVGEMGNELANAMWNYISSTFSTNAEGWAQFARVVGPENRLLVERVRGPRAPARHEPHAAGAKPAVGRVVVVQRGDVEAVLQGLAQAGHGEHGRLVGGRFTADVDADEEKRAPSFLRIRQISSNATPGSGI